MKLVQNELTDSHRKSCCEELCFLGLKQMQIKLSPHLWADWTDAKEMLGGNIFRLDVDFSWVLTCLAILARYAIWPPLSYAPQLCCCDFEWDVSKPVHRRQLCSPPVWDILPSILGHLGLTQLLSRILNSHFEMHNCLTLKYLLIILHLLGRFDYNRKTCLILKNYYLLNYSTVKAPKLT